MKKNDRKIYLFRSNIFFDFNYSVLVLVSVVPLAACSALCHHLPLRYVSFNLYRRTLNCAVRLRYEWQRRRDDIRFIFQRGTHIITKDKQCQ